MKICTYVLFTAQISFGIFQADLITGVLMTSIMYKFRFTSNWLEFQLISNCSLFLVVFILYIIILRKLIFKLSNKYPEYYKRERSQIITSVSFILASIFMRIVEYGLYSIGSIKEELEKS